MSDRTAKQAAHAYPPSDLFDLAFPLTFGAVAILTTTVWLGAIGGSLGSQFASCSPAFLIRMVGNIRERKRHLITSLYDDWSHLL